MAKVGAIIATASVVAAVAALLVPLSADKVGNMRVATYLHSAGLPLLLLKGYAPRL